MMACLGNHIPPSCPEEVVLCLRSQEVSSNRLRMEGHGKSVENNLAAAANEGAMTILESTGVENTVQETAKYTEL